MRREIRHRENFVIRVGRIFFIAAVSHFWSVLHGKLRKYVSGKFILCKMETIWTKTLLFPKLKFSSSLKILFSHLGNLWICSLSVWQCQFKLKGWFFWRNVTYKFSAVWNQLKKILLFIWIADFHRSWVN